MSLTIAALYRFTPFADPAALQGPLQAVCDASGVRGTLLLAGEGINGTIAGPAGGIDAVLAHIRALPGCGDVQPKFSQAEEMPFRRMKVRLKREIVTMGQPGVDPRAAVGAYVPPDQWNALVADPDVVLIDTRNDYEVGIGTFEGAINPGTESFRDFPAWWEQNADALKGKTVAMFCTGGIRCEKATNYLMSRGVEDVRHLEGGILRYLEEVPPQDSTWNGSCFVFDGRVSVRHGLEEGPHILCHACRRPLLPEDTKRPEYEEGVRCHNCAGSRDGEDLKRFRERQAQIARARARGESHLG